MLEQGLIDEVRTLWERGDCHTDLPAIRAVGYRQVWSLLEGEIDAITCHENSRGHEATGETTAHVATELAGFDLDDDQPRGSPRPKSFTTVEVVNSAENAGQTVGMHAGNTVLKRCCGTLADAGIVVEYRHSTPVEFFVANVLAAYMRFS